MDYCQLSKFSYATFNVVGINFKFGSSKQSKLDIPLVLSKLKPREVFFLTETHYELKDAIDLNCCLFERELCRPMTPRARTFSGGMAIGYRESFEKCVQILPMKHFIKVGLYSKLGYYSVCGNLNLHKATESDCCLCILTQESLFGSYHVGMACAENHTYCVCSSRPGVVYRLSGDMLQHFLVLFLSVFLMFVFCMSLLFSLCLFLCGTSNPTFFRKCHSII